MKKLYTLVSAVCTALFVNAQVFSLDAPAQITDISNTGLAVGHVGGVAFFKWSVENSGQILGESGENGIAGNANISADGNVISMTLANPANNGAEEAVLYTVSNGNLTFLGNLGTTADNNSSSAWGMSSDGKNIAGFAWTTPFSGQAVYWKNGSPTVSLGGSTAGGNSRANSITNDGTVIVGWQDSEIGLREGVRWVNGVAEVLKDNDGKTLGEAFAVSADGKTICGVANGTGEGYIWNETEGTIFISNDTPGYITSVSALSDDGKTAVGFSYDPAIGFFEGEGFIWTKEGGKVNLNDYADSQGYDDLDITFSVPTGISPNGKYIGGIGGNFVTMEAEGFMIKLPGANMATSSADVSNSITIYPNPVRDILHLSSATKVSDIEIYSVTGQKVFSTTTVKNDGLDVSKFKKGTYILKARTALGMKITKFLKK